MPDDWIVPKNDWITPPGPGVAPAQPSAVGSLYEPGVLSDDPRYWPPQEQAQPWWKFGYGPFAGKAPGPERGTFVPLVSGEGGKIEPGVPGIAQGPVEAARNILHTDPSKMTPRQYGQTVGPEGLTAGSAGRAGTSYRVLATPRPSIPLTPKQAASSRVGRTAWDDARAVLGRDPTPQELADHARRMIDAGNKSGQDVRMLDVGGEATRDEARRSANISDRSRNQFTTFVEPRWKDQATRIWDWLRNRMGNPEDAHLELEQIKEAAKDPRSQAYIQAFTDGAEIKPSINLAGIMQSKLMQGFARKADEAYETSRLAGNTVQDVPIQPITRDGLFRPNNLPLEYWDAIKRAIDVAVEKGSPTEQKHLASIRKQIVDELDQLVPSYKVARGIAANVFNAGDAVEAGTLIAKNPKILPSEIAQVRAKTPQEEWGRVQVGFLTEYQRRILSTGDRQNILLRLAQNPLERQKIEAMLGKQIADEFQAVLFTEEAMQKSYRGIVGGPTTAKQSAKMRSPGIAPSTVISATAWMITQNPRALLLGALLYGVRQAESALQVRTAEHVADMLLSKDPSIYYDGIKQAAPFLPNLRGYILSAAPRVATQDMGRGGDSTNKDQPSALPPDPKSLVPGRWYKNQKGDVRRWDGNQFMSK